MIYPIVEIKSKKLPLMYGLFLKARGKKTILINIHGTASNFYEEYFIEFLSHKLIEKNISLLSVNTSGAYVYDAYEKIGAAVEKFEDCVQEIDAWINFALDKGYKKNYTLRT